VTCSPKKSSFSNTFKTQSLGLFNADMHESLSESLNLTDSQSIYKFHSNTLPGNQIIGRNSPSAMATTGTTIRGGMGGRTTEISK